jgi:hypothetical protein
MRRAIFLSCLVASIVCSLASVGGERGPGKYCGVVVFDRWDGCILYSGVYVMYVSENVKESLRRYAGNAVQIHATEVYQPINPGDGRIEKLEYLGAPPTGKRNWVDLEGIRLSTSANAPPSGKAAATITIENTGRTPVKLFRQELALTLLMKRSSSDQKSFLVSDGPSFALITRQSFQIGGSEPRWKGEGITNNGPYEWTIGEENSLPHEFTLKPNERKEVIVYFDLPDGQYDFLCGYGGGVHEGKCVASNLSAFDIEAGKAKVVGVKAR